ncbi:regulator of G-protein signaling 3 [Plakobranchus ocellatus]|uniref:Regulator of G-protein signaling 3 n=1 Tax=Plakobranchus ocellatus TaxID=259542 RepID=A0AAV4DND8_9GAST|nr:regulator of G-protein signaling 3 [Plakobranchus ocellatus]
MRVLTCLSENVSMVYDSPPRSKRWTDRLRFKQRKRKRGTVKDITSESGAESRRPFDQPACNKGDGSRLYCSRADIENKENEDPSAVQGFVREQNVSQNVRLAIPGCENPTRLGSSTLSSTFSSSSSSYFIPRRIHHPPLPPIPSEGDNLDTSIYVKELNNTQDEAVDSDYLPLSEVLSPLREDTSMDDKVTSPESTDISVGTYEILPQPALRTSESGNVLDRPTPKFSQTLQNVQNQNGSSTQPTPSRRLYSPSSSRKGPASSTASNKYSARGRSCQPVTSYRGSSSCSVGSSTSSVISTGQGFNKAFLRGVGSLVSQIPNPSTGSLQPEYHLPYDSEERVPPIYHPHMTPPSPCRTSVPRDDLGRNSPCGASETSDRPSPSGACSLGILSPANSSGSIFVSSMSENSSPSLTSMIAQRGGVNGSGGGAEYSLDADDEEEITQDDMTQVTQETTQEELTQWSSQEVTPWDLPGITQMEEQEDLQEIPSEQPGHLQNDHPVEALPTAVWEEPRYVNVCQQLVYSHDMEESDAMLRYSSARVNGFKQHVVSNPDPYDTVEEEDEEGLNNPQQAKALSSGERGEDYVDVDADVPFGGGVDVCSTGNNGYVNICPSSSASEFLGCMSFGVQHLLKKDLNGWYYLLTEEVGRKKHLQAHSRPKPVLPAASYKNIPEINTAVEGQERIMITVPRGKNGFGFSFVDELPPRVGRVDRASPAEQAGIKKGDAVIRINGKNVSRSTCEGVARMVKKLSPQSLTLELQRDHIIAAATTTEVTATGTTTVPALSGKRGVGTSTDHLYESIREGADNSRRSEYYREGPAVRNHPKDVEFMTDDDDDDNGAGFAYPRHGIPTNPSVTSTPRPVGSYGHMHQVAIETPGIVRNPTFKQENIHRLMSLELNYIDFMHYGIERYSRPLRHCIVTAHQHRTIFQNVEKVVTISEFHIKQMQDNTSSVNSDTDDSQSSEASLFPNSVALIYYSKIHMFCQAYEDYAYGLMRSNTMLRELRKNKEFIHFLKEPGTEEGQTFGHPSISAFINRPVQHIQELHNVLSDIFSSTPLTSPDFHTLQQVVVKLSHSVANIAGLSSAGRVQSMDSLTSSAGGSSTYSQHSHSKGAASGRSQHSQVYMSGATVGRSAIGSHSTSSGKGSMASLASSCSSSERDPLLTQQQQQQPVFQVPSAMANKDVLRIQDCLAFAPNVKSFQLCQEDRHLIFQGDIYHRNLQQQQEGNSIGSNSSSSSSRGAGSWGKSQLLLFSDLLLLVEEMPNENGGTENSLRQLYVTQDPIAVQDIMGIEVHRKYASEFILHVCPSGSHMIPTVFRAPSAQDKFVWTSLLEQRVLAVKGSRLQHYGSTRDISSVKTSVIL